MTLWPVYLIAVIATGGCLILWFRDVLRVMRERKNTVDTARKQLIEWDNRAVDTPGDPQTTAILERCKSIYEQAVDHYNRVMRKPFNCLPAYLMGFRIMNYSVIIFEPPFDNGDIPIVLPDRKDNHS